MSSYQELKDLRDYKILRDMHDRGRLETGEQNAELIRLEAIIKQIKLEKCDECEEMFHWIEMSLIGRHDEMLCEWCLAKRRSSGSGYNKWSSER